jgi:hypothetical protein
MLNHSLGWRVESHSVYYREGGPPFLLVVVMVVIKGVSRLVWLVLGLHYKDFHIFGSQLGGWTSKGLK